MKNLLQNGVALGLLLMASACDPADAEFDAAAYEAELLDWRAERLARLRSPTGYLAQVGLHWIEDGRYTMGSAPDADIVLPATAAERVAELEARVARLEERLADLV